jgi:hypothetical protein
MKMFDDSIAIALQQEACSSTKNRVRRSFHAFVSTLLVAWLGVVLATAPMKADPIPNLGGPIMQTAKAFLIFWQPDGGNNTFAGGGSADSLYEQTLQQFFKDLGGTDYFKIATQYASTCSGAPCSPQNTSTGVAFGGNWVDTTAFPVGRTLSDTDIRDSIKRALDNNSGWSAGLDAQFIVFLPQNVKECRTADICSGDYFCAYHSAFTLNGVDVVYAVMPQVRSIGDGCGLNSSTLTESENTDVNYSPSTTPHSQLDVDWEIVILSHEFFEAVTDPLRYSRAYHHPRVREVGDICNNMVGGFIAPDGSNVLLNGHPYLVQEIWSNGINGCALGRTVTLTVVTGSDDLRGDSSATAALQAEDGATIEQVTLKGQSDPSWDNNSTNQRSFRLNANQVALRALAVTLTSHNSFPETDDNWNIDLIDIKVTDGVGTPLCEQRYVGSPAVRLTGSAGTASFDTSNCRPQPPPNARR